jgi:hypothetical protein
MNTKQNQFRSLIAASGQLSTPAVQPFADVPSVESEPSRPTALTPAARTSRRVGKRMSPEYVQIGPYIPKSLHLALKRALLTDPHGRDLSQLIAELCTDWVARTAD